MFFLFDIDDTLYDLEDPFRIAFKDMFGYEPDGIHNIFLDFRKYNNMVYEKAILGEITMEEMCIYRAKNAFKDHGIIIDDQDAIDFQLTYLRDKKFIHLNSFIEKTLKLLSEKKIPIGIISNGPHKEQFEKAHYLGLDRFVKKEHIFISEDVGHHKPDREIFDYAAEVMDIPENEDVYFVGDSLKVDIAGAKGADFKAVWLNRRNYKTDSSIEPDFTAHSFEELFKVISALVKDY